MKVLPYLSLKNITDTTADIYFYGEIVGDEWDKWTDTDKCPQDVIDALKQAEGKDIDIYINSPGGSVFAGVAIYNILVRHKGKKTVHVDGVAASIASVIAMCGDKIIMPSNSCLMIHCPLCLVVGNAKELRKMADDLDTIQGSIETVYETKLVGKTTIKQIREMMDAETWLTASEAAKYFDVEITEANAAAAKANYMLPKFKNMPENIKNNILTAAENEKNKEREKLMLELELLNI